MRLYEPSLKKLEYALQVGMDWRPLVRTQLDEIGCATEHGNAGRQGRRDGLSATSHGGILDGW